MIANRKALSCQACGGDFLIKYYEQFDQNLCEECLELTEYEMADAIDMQKTLGYYGSIDMTWLTL